MVESDQSTVLARRAARLLPAPPDTGDAFGMLAWEELVLATAKRLGMVARCDTRHLPPDVVMPAPGTKVTWQTLLKLGALLYSDDAIGDRAAGWFTSTTTTLSETAAARWGSAENAGACAGGVRRMRGRRVELAHD